MHLEDIDASAQLLSKILLEGGELGWNLLLMLQKTCRNFPVPLTQLLAANQADYRALVESLELNKSFGVKQTGTGKKGNGTGSVVGGGRRK